MRAKLSALSLAILVICLLNRTDAIIETIGFLSSLATLEQFVEVMYAKVSEGPDTAHEVLAVLQQMNTDVQYQLWEISNLLSYLPAITDHVSKRNKLQSHVNHIGFTFETACEMYKNIQAGRREMRETYDNFRREYEPRIEEDIYEIKRMLLDQRTTTFITRSLTDGLKYFENRCVSKQSELQMLQGLLATFKVSISQYLLTKIMMYKFLEPYKKDRIYFVRTKINILEGTKRKYNEVVRDFKEIMKKASRDLWRCDPKEFPARYSNKPEDPYHELMAFSKYVFNEDIFSAHADGRCDHDRLTCPAIKKVDKCGGSNSGHLCKKTRKCANELTDCRRLNSGRSDSTYLCLNNDKTAVNRYTSLVPKSRVGEMTCSKEQRMLVNDIHFGTDNSDQYYCDYCQCICLDNEYYFNTKIQYSDTENHKVIIGARIVVEDRVINIQIQQGALLPNGVINPSTVEWMPIDKYTVLRRKISWEEFSRVDLTMAQLPKDSVLTGLGFSTRLAELAGDIGYLSFRISEDSELEKWPNCCTGRITPSYLMVDTSKEWVYLDVQGHKMNFSAGLLTPPIFYNFDYPSSNMPEKELKLEDVDVPTKSIKKNKPISDGNQFVRFQITSLKKDGGQTTIPFIDTQEVVTNPSSPLGGAGLMLRGQPGFGGFLALQVLTYDMVDYISEIPKDVDLLSQIVKPSARKRINSG